MYLTKSEHTALALSVIVAIANKQDINPIKSRKIPPELIEKSACFVSLHMIDGSLRGCIGTIEPRENNLFYEIISNAISASTHDSRFPQVKVSELEKITVSVDVLGTPYPLQDITELDPARLGVIVTDGSFMRGVLLPNIESIDTVEKQISIAKRKAGLQNYDNSTLKFFAFTSTRFH
jgi:AmmeMemoRadiSam system protein A